MLVSKSSENGSRVFSVEGRLDMITGPKFQSELIAAFDENPNIILDFEKLVYISSAGLRVLLMAQKTAAAKKGSLTIRKVSPEIMEIFSITALSDILTII